MCFGDNETTSTVTTTPSPRTPEEQEAIRIALDSLRMRQSIMPFLMETVGIGQDQAGNIARLPPTPRQQALDRLADSSIGGASDAQQMMMSRLQNSQSMIPGLMASVQASMAPDTRLQATPQPRDGGGSQDLLRQLMALIQRQGTTGGPGGLGGAGVEARPPPSQIGGTVTRFDPARVPGGSGIGLPLAAGAAGLGAGALLGARTTTTTRGGQQAGNIPPIPPSPPSLGGGTPPPSLDTSVPVWSAGGVGVTPEMSQLFGQYGVVPPSPGAGPFPLTNPPLPPDPTDFSFGVNPPFSGQGGAEMPPMPTSFSGAGAIGAGASGGSSAFGSGVASIDPSLLTGAGSLGVGGPAGAGTVGLADFVPSWLGGTGTALAPTAAFAAPLMMAITSMLSSGEHDRAANQAAMESHWRWAAQHPGQELFGPNILMNYLGTQIGDEARFRREQQAVIDAHNQERARLIASPISEEEKLARLQAWDRANPFGSEVSVDGLPPGWTRDSVAGRISRGEFTWDPRDPWANLYQDVTRIVLENTPGTLQHRMRGGQIPGREQGRFGFSSEPMIRW